MNRRGFFGRLAAIGAGAAASTAVIAPAGLGASEPVIRPNWHIGWSGWREADTQLAKFGYWFAYPLPIQRGALSLIATTTGTFRAYRELESIDISTMDGWPASMLAPEKDFDLAQRRARSRLLLAADFLDRMDGRQREAAWSLLRNGVMPTELV